MLPLTLSRDAALRMLASLLAAGSVREPAGAVVPRSAAIGAIGIGAGCCHGTVNNAGLTPANIHHGGGGTRTQLGKPACGMFRQACPRPTPQQSKISKWQSCM